MEKETTIKIENIDDLKKLLDTAKEQCEQLTETIEEIRIALVKKESRLHS